jgi:NADP-dependent 3-hydroxy acid dehydrogenase YdfG
MEMMGLLHATDAAMQVIMEQGSGDLVSISSVAGRKSGPFGDAYCVRDQVRRLRHLQSIASGAGQRQCPGDGNRAGGGRDRTPRPHHRRGGQPRPKLLLEQLDPPQAENVENAIAYCITQPKRVSVNEVLIRPTQQAN